MQVLPALYFGLGSWMEKKVIESGQGGNTGFKQKEIKQNKKYMQ